MDSDVKRRSVTANDRGSVYGSVIQWLLYSGRPQQTGLPPYWSPARDYYLRLLLYQEFHDFWASAIGIAITKMSSLSWQLDSSQPRVRNYFQDLLLSADDNQSWVKFLSRHLIDFLSTDNGAFVEIVRASSSAGSRIIGLMHLDSVRCTRTGDPDIPVVYRDTKGIAHEMRAHQVLTLADMPSPADTYHGVGLCATSRAWSAIRKLEAIERYIYEKVSGDRALALDLVGGPLEKDIETGVQAAKEMNEARGNTSYLGSVMIAVPSDVPLTHQRINFAELPDGFDYDKQVNNCILTFANALGIDVQDLQPLTGRPLGSGEQSKVLEDKAEGKGLAAWRQQWTHLLNQYVLPDSVVFAFSEKDLNTQKRQADVNQTIAETVATMVEKVGLTPDQGKQVLADEGVIPEEFVPADTTPRESIGDSDKPEVEDQAAEETAPAAEETPPSEDAAKEAQPADGSDPFAEKSITSVSRKFHASLRSLATLGFVSDSSILADVRRTIKDGIADAYIEGLAEGGIPADEMESDDALMIVELTDQQAPYITDFVRAVRAAKNDKAAQRDILNRRIDLWTAAVEAAGTAGLNSAKANEMVEFAGEDGAESCTTCQHLKGQKHRRKWWEQKGLVPRDPRFRDNFECGGWQCQHELIPMR